MYRSLGKGAKLFVVALTLGGCLETFSPPLNLVEEEVLVIDGFLNASEGSAKVELSRAQALTATDPPKVEVGATVSVVDDLGKSVVLPPAEPGIYQQANLTVDLNRRYQLKVKTADGSEYESDLVEVRKAPPITSLVVEPKFDFTALEVSLSARDNAKETRYYRWDYIETWEYTSTFRSDFELVNRLPVPRKPGEGIYRCYRSRPSTRILVGTSIQLSDDVISNQLLETIPVGDQRTVARYSIEVRQRAITRVEFEYLKQLQKSTEGLGGLFDPQPSQLYGNLRKTGDAKVTVLGYFSAGTAQKMRTFYHRDQLPVSMKVLPRDEKCVQDTVCLTIPNPYGLKCHLELKTLKGTELITGSLFKEFETIGFLCSTAECSDCRLQGGSTVKPDFW